MDKSLSPKSDAADLNALIFGIALKLTSVSLGRTTTV